MDHHLDTLSSTFSSVSLSASAFAGPVSSPSANMTASPAAGRQLKAGQAITLRAQELGVLRIAHGRVWATLTGVGPYSRVQAGDHFLSRGETLTLLPGQELVIESFGIGHAATAQFMWENACAAAIALPAAAADGAGVLLPLRDLRHALGLVAGASGRLVLGLAHGALAGFKILASNFAMVSVATRNRSICAGGTFDASKRHANTRLTEYRVL